MEDYTMATITLSEMLELMEPQAKLDKALIARCIDGIGLYAAQIAEKDMHSPKIGELRETCDLLYNYWWLDGDDLDTDYTGLLASFDARVQEAGTGGKVECDIFQTAPNVIHGLHCYCKDMVTGAGAEGAGSIKKAVELMKEIGSHWNYDHGALDVLTGELEAELSAMFDTLKNETGINFEAWMAVTSSSRNKWVEDEIFRLNGRGAFYFTGGEDGVYMKIHKDGRLEAGNYEGAFPHIGEATFQTVVEKQFGNYSEAYTAAMEAGGKQFLVDMFSGSETQPLVRVAVEDRASVLKQIQESRSALKTPKPKQEQGQTLDSKQKNKNQHGL
jgi:hypothetical protein